MALLPLVAVQVVYVVATVMGIALAVVLWKNREKTGAVALGFANLCAALWAVSLLGITVSGDSLSLAFVRSLYLGVVLSIPALFVFALEYTGRERFVSPTLLVLLSIHPVVTMFFVFFNPGNLFFPEIAEAAVARGGDPELLWGPAFYVHTVYSYLLLIGVTAMILDLLVRSSRPLYRGQAVALLAATVVPWTLNAIYLFGPIEFDSTPVGFVVSTALFTVAIVRYRFIDVTPMAREKVVENVRDGMFVVDTDDRILDSNPAFRGIAGVDEDSLVGTNAPELFGDVPDILTVYEEMTAGESTTERQVTYRGRHLNVQATPIRDDRSRQVAWLFLINDVTELVQRERDLEQQVEKLDQFASIVSHDLRNPLNVARGYVQQARATENLDHLEKTEEAMERMEAIIDDALALARESEGVTQPTDVSLADVARDAWRNVDTQGASLDVTDEQIVADHDRLQRLFENLFRNAVEHGVTSPDSRTRQDDAGHDDDGVSDDGADTIDLTVEVGIDDEGGDGTVTVYVADDGVGIPDEKLDTVFEGGYTTGEDGTGLGLSIVEQIAGAHGWDVGVTHSETGGARFEIRGVARRPDP